jgi:hypothetical protein
MELVDFYRALLPASGRYALFSVPRKRHIWASSIEELVQYTERTHREADWYYATGTYTDDRRKQETCTAKRCLYLDIDAGPKKFSRDPDNSYPEQSDAVVALSRFIRESLLVPTYVISSGAGLHVYWALDADATPEEWMPVATALEALALASGLKVDTSCTTDSARVLRPLGALHNNGERVTLLKSFDKVWNLAKLSAKLPTPEPVALPAPTSRAKLDVNAGLQMWEPTPSSAFKVAEKCAALHEVAACGGDVPEPHWRAMLGLVRFSVEGIDAAHEWSRGHPDYDPAQTEEKFNRYEGTGPTTCATFSKFSKACKDCEHNGKITSPLQLGRMTAEQVEALPEDKRPAPAPKPDVPAELPFSTLDLGEGYRVVQVAGRWQMQGRKLVEKESDAGTEKSYVWVKFYDDVFWLDGWTGAGRHLDEVAMVTLRAYTNSSGHTQTWEFPSANLSGAAELFKALAGLGITRSTIDPTASQIMHNYVNSQFIKAKTAPARMALRERFGLQYDGDGPYAKLICAHGPFVLRGDGTIEAAILTKKLAAYHSAYQIADLPDSPTGRWPATVWAEHILPGAAKQVEFYKRYYQREGYEVAQLAIMLSLASPLLVFVADSPMIPGSPLPPVGLTVSLYSSSTGQGKTAMQKAAASAFGDPSYQVLSGSSKDATPTYQSAYLALVGTMPAFFDEVTQNTKEDVAALVNRIAQGRERGRSEQNGDPRDVKTSALVGSVSTNVPQRELLMAAQKSSDALQMRLVELTCEFPPILEGAHVQYEKDRDELLGAHLGALGAVLHLLILRNETGVLRKLVQERFQEAAGIIVGSTQRERFLQRGMAVALAAHDMLAKIGLGIFERSVLIEQYGAAAREAVTYSVATSRSPDDMLRKMISDLAPSIIVTQTETNGRFDRSLEPVLNRTSLRAPYVGRRVESGRYVHLLVDAMREWCQENQCSYGEILQHARRCDFIKMYDGGSQKPTTITKGTDLSRVHGQCVTINEGALFPEEATADTGGKVVGLQRTKENDDGSTKRAEPATR